MRKLRGTATAVAALSVCAALVLSACSSASPSADPQLSEQAPTAAPFDVPTISISYELDGETHTATAELAVSSCSAHAFTAMAVDGHSGSAIFPTPDQSDRTRITATVFGDEVVAFQGDGTPEYTEDAGVVRAHTVDLVGTATVTPADEGAGDTGDTQVSAALTAVLECNQ